jgi:hypothetical protein
MTERRERLLRELLAAIIGSKISYLSLRELADLLGSDEEFRRALQTELTAISRRGDARTPSYPEKFEPPNVPKAFDSLEESILKVVQLHGITKPELVRAIQLVLGTPESQVPARNTIRSIISAFCSVASPSQVSGLLQKFGVVIQQDAFLKGITKSSEDRDR